MAIHWSRLVHRETTYCPPAMPAGPAVQPVNNRKVGINTSMYYHIVTDLESRFATLQDAIDAYTNTKIVPRVPASKLEYENHITPRICVCKTIPDCLTAISVGSRMRRCLASNVYIPTCHMENREAYPVLILEFPDNIAVYTPSELDVPDIEVSNERWILHEIVPTKVTLRWIAFDSILLENPPDHPDNLVAISCKFVSNTAKYDHPWLNGRGHVLHSTKLDTQYEDYDKLPIARRLGVIQTTKAILQSIEDIMSWKIASGRQTVRLESRTLPEPNLQERPRLVITCKKDPDAAPELSLALYQGQTKLCERAGYTDMDELERTGLTYQDSLYRPRIVLCKDDGTAGTLPFDASTPQTKEEREQMADFARKTGVDAQAFLNDPNLTDLSEQDILTDAKTQPRPDPNAPTEPIEPDEHECATFASRHS